MPTPRRVLVTVLVSAAGAVAAMGCDRAGDARRADSVAAVPPATLPSDSPRAPVSSGWDLGVGPVLLVAAERSDAAIAVFPEVQGEHVAAGLQLDTGLVRRSTATLVNRAGAAAAATVGERTTPGEDEDCVGWPMFKVVARGGGVPTPWTAGFVGARLRPVSLDSVGSLSTADSAALVVEVTRLASMLPVGDNAARLRGLPFVVQDARRFRTTDVDALVAQVIRRVHQEANPVEERILLVAERDTTQPHEQRPHRYTLAFHERAVGPEETLEGTEVLAVLTVQATARPMLVIAREAERGVRYAIIERFARLDWRVKWTSALVRC